MANTSMLDMSLDDVISKTRDSNHQKMSGRRFGGRQPQNASSSSSSPLGKNRRGPRSVAILKSNNRDQSFRRQWLDTSGQWNHDMFDDGQMRNEGNSRRMPRRTASPRYSGGPTRFVKVGNIDFSIMKEDLEELFESVGAISKCWVDYDRTDRSKGTGGVIFEDEADAIRAVETFSGRLIEGQPIQLEFGAPSNRWVRRRYS